MPDEDVLKLIRSQTLAIIQQVTAQPKPSYELDGQRVSWSEYLGRLTAVVEWCNAQLARETPCERRSCGTT
ncbi:hypothetical protein [Thermogutta sp.]|jgi:hypothetical protein|uniref:hypothetical protein n=1 Tax=Thermogutta sp. TaxID=1962930 RepID=UPI00321F8B7D